MLRTESVKRPEPPERGLTAKLRKLPVGDRALVIKPGSRSAAFMAASRLGIKITTQVGDDGKCRVWRLT